MSKSSMPTRLTTASRTSSDDLVHLSSVVPIADSFRALNCFTSLVGVFESAKTTAEITKIGDDDAPKPRSPDSSTYMMGNYSIPANSDPLYQDRRIETFR